LLAHETEQVVPATNTAPAIPCGASFVLLNFAAALAEDQLP
jgi:hypothetical protein